MLSIKILQGWKWLASFDLGKTDDSQLRIRSVHVCSAGGGFYSDSRDTPNLINKMTCVPKRKGVCIMSEMTGVKLVRWERKKEKQKGGGTGTSVILLVHVGPPILKEVQSGGLRTKLSWPKKIAWRGTPGALLQRWHILFLLEVEEVWVHLTSCFPC